MNHEARKIKATVILAAGTLEAAARQMSDEIYAFNGNQLSKVINGHSQSPIIKDRLARFLEKHQSQTVNFS